MARTFETREAYARQRSSDFRVGVIGLVVGLGILAWHVASAPEAASDYTRIEVVPSRLSVVRESRHLYGLRIETAGGTTYEAQDNYVRSSGFTAEGLLAALAPGEPVTLWVLDPDAERPRVRGIASARVSAGPQTGVASDQREGRLIWILGLGFAGLGALSVGLGLSRRPPAE